MGRRVLQTKPVPDSKTKELVFEPTVQQLLAGVGGIDIEVVDREHGHHVDLATFWLHGVVDRGGPLRHGRGNIRCWPAGGTRIEVSSPGYQRVVRTFEVPSGGTVPLTFEMEPASALEVQVLLPNGEPAAGARIDCQAEELFGLRPEIVMITNRRVCDNEGRTLIDIAAGPHLLRAKHQRKDGSHVSDVLHIDADTLGDSLVIQLQEAHAVVLEPDASAAGRTFRIRDTSGSRSFRTRFAAGSRAASCSPRARTTSSSLSDVGEVLCEIPFRAEKPELSLSIGLPTGG